MRTLVQGAIATILLLGTPSISSPQGLARSALAPEETLFSWHINAATTGACPNTGSGCAGLKLPSDRGFRVTAVAGHVMTASGGGAGISTWRVSDGSNNCDCTVACSLTNTAGPQRAETCTGTCTFAPGSVVQLNLQASTCTTTQPTWKNIQVVGKWT